MNEILIAPSILSADFSKLGDEIRSVEFAGADWIHVDVMDGQFVPNITMGPFIVETCRKITRLPIDIHLMIEHPEKHIEAFANSGADRLSIHIENNPNIHRTIQEIHQSGCKAGVVLNPGTPASSIESILPFIEQVLVMSVNPGFSGQEFIPEVLTKIKAIKQRINDFGLDAIIQIDGGISSNTLPKAHLAGVDCFVAATAIFKHPKGVKTAIAELRNSVK